MLFPSELHNLHLNGVGGVTTSWPWTRTLSRLWPGLCFSFPTYFSYVGALLVFFFFFLLLKTLENFALAQSLFNQLDGSALDEKCCLIRWMDRSFVQNTERDFQRVVDEKKGEARKLKDLCVCVWQKMIGHTQTSRMVGVRCPLNCRCEISKGSWD